MNQKTRVLGVVIAGSVAVTTAGTAGPSLWAAPPKASKAKPAKPTNLPPGTNAAQTAPTGVADNTPLTEDQKIVHVLNRMGFGPRPGDVEKVRQTGLSRYMEAQLYPETVADTALDAKVSGLTLLGLSNGELRDLYAQEKSKQVKLLTKKKKNQQGEADAAMMTEQTPAAPAKSPREMLAELSPEDRMAVMEARQAQQKIRNASLQLAMDKVVRASESERQFQEVLVDFWSNHFNIDMRKGLCQVYKISDERDVIRKHVFGKFRDLLEASAKSPAMLFYLDNAQSQVAREPGPLEMRRMQAIERAAQNGNPQAKLAENVIKNRGKGGLNENYAREIMELHTLGVDGGYTQKDVTEVARCLTGWTIDRQGGGFEFTPRRHDNGEKMVLGRTIPAGGGQQDGETVLTMLAQQPSTMRFIATKLCRRLVADEPPATLVNKCVQTWKRTDGNLREVYRTIVTSPEFLSRASYRQKLKSPFEYAVSSVRALGGTFDLTPDGLGMMRFRLLKAGKEAKSAAQNQTVLGQISTMGQPLYQYQAPTGYTEDSRKWVSSGALVSRLNFALTLANGKMADVQLPRTGLTPAGDTGQTVNAIGGALLHGEMTPSTRATLLKQVAATPDETRTASAGDTQARLTALVLGSPEFQRR